jgi:hypothetical protein
MISNETDALSALWADYRDQLGTRLKLVKLHYKGDYFGDDENLLWHFTRLSALRSMAHGREIWLSDLARSNDADEIRYGLRRVGPVVREASSGWANRDHAHLAVQLAEEAVSEIEADSSVFGFCVSDAPDTAHHWGAYGGGLQTQQTPDDPHVAIGFDAQAFAYPVTLSEDEPEVFLLNVVFGRDWADLLARYWARKAQRALQVLDEPRLPLSRDKVLALVRRMLLVSCALVKAEGWRSECEFRLLYLPDPSGDPKLTAARPDGAGSYVPLVWSPDKLPVRKVMPHPLADMSAVSGEIAKTPGWEQVTVVSSELKPRARP